ncbi:GTPase-activating protein, putative [Hepatocystis sp. ex Piliocolobus tephrosceles]|nr:GTPase-activating protein, putative [Hepatocystis sp. ex Piliocolobus tephrosceles]
MNIRKNVTSIVNKMKNDNSGVKEKKYTSNYSSNLLLDIKKTKNRSIDEEKNKIPNQCSNINIVKSKSNSYDSINVSWNKGSNTENKKEQTDRSLQVELKNEYNKLQEHNELKREDKNVTDNKRDEKNIIFYNESSDKYLNKNEEEENAKKENKHHDFSNIEKSSCSQKSFSNSSNIVNNVNEYNHNIIYHELYIELLHVNKMLQDEINALKKTIEIQKTIIKSKDNFLLSDMNRNKKLNNVKSVNNNYFTNFFNKKKKKSKDNFFSISSKTGNTLKTNFFSSYKGSEKKKKREKKDNTIKNCGNNDNTGIFLECEKVYNNEIEISEMKLNEEKEKKKKYKNKSSYEINEYKHLPLSDGDEYIKYMSNEENETTDPVDKEKHEIDSSLHNNDVYKINYKIEKDCLGNTEKRNFGYSNEKIESSTYGKDKKVKEDNGKDEILSIQEVTSLTFWYEEILPLINNEKKKKNLIDLVKINPMPRIIKTYFWEMNIINKLNLTDQFVQTLVKNTNFIQSYIYTYNTQYKNHINKYFKSLDELFINDSNEYTLKTDYVNRNNDNVTNILKTDNVVDGFENLKHTSSKGEENKIKSILNLKNKGDIGEYIKDEGESVNNNLGDIGSNRKESHNSYKSDNDNNHDASNNSDDDKTDNNNNNINKKNKNFNKDITTYNIDVLQNFSIQKFFYQILIDLDRTMYIIKKNQEYYKKYNTNSDHFLLSINLCETKAKLNLLLQMYVLFKPELGYVQGMSYIALVFLLYCKLEKAFVYFANFMDRKNIFNMYSFNKEEIKIYIYTIKEILAKQNIETYKEIVKHYNIDNIFIQWMYTIFLTCLPFQIFIRIFDIYTFYENIIYETILCIFTYINKLHSMDNVDNLIKNLPSFSFNTHIQEDKFWRMLKKSKIKKGKILYYREKYFNKVYKNELNEK